MRAIELTLDRRSLRSRLLSLTESSRKARGIEIRGEAAILDTGGKEIMPAFADEMVRIRPQRIIGWGIVDPDSRTPTTHSIP